MEMICAVKNDTSDDKATLDELRDAIVEILLIRDKLLF